MVGIDVSKTCKPKNLRRAILALLLIAPLVYLFGTQFFALAGAHGEVVFADDYHDVDSFVISNDSFVSGTYSTDGYEIVSNSRFMAYKFESDYPFTLTWLGTTFGVDSQMRLAYYDDDGNYVDNIVRYGSNSSVFGSISYGLEYSRFILVYYSNLPASSAYIFPLDTRFTSDSLVLINDRVSFTDYVFGHFFKDNWVSSIGKDVYVGEEVGFKPIGDMIRFIDDNALHLQDTEWGDFIAGYAYYCANVIFVYECFVLCVMFITIPTKVLDYFYKED